MSTALLVLSLVQPPEGVPDPFGVLDYVEPQGSESGPTPAEKANDELDAMLEEGAGTPSDDPEPAEPVWEGPREADPVEVEPATNLRARAIVVQLDGGCASVDAGEDGPNCTIGKPCGQTCIEQSDNCTIPPPDPGGITSMPGFITGMVLAPIGLGTAIIGGALMAKNPKPSAVTLRPAGNGGTLRVRF